MALVLALGSLGVGYAMWFDTVTISGDVQTGSVDIEIVNASFDRVYKNLETDALVYTHHVVMPGGSVPAYLGSPYLLVGETTATRVDESTLVISYNNIFPIPGSGWNGSGFWFTDLSLHNNGTIPVKLAVDTVVTGIPADWVTVMTDSFTPFPSGDPLEGIQLEPCHTLSIGIGIKIPQPPDNVGMNLSGTITVTITGIQWNEYTAP